MRQSTHACWFGPCDVWAVGWGGTVLRFDGTTWQLVPSGTTEYLHGVWGSSANDVWAVGRGGFVVHWDGTKWTQVSVDTSNELFAVRARSSTDVWVAGAYGLVLHWNGTTWAVSPTLAGDPIHDLWRAAGATGDLFAVGSGFILRRSEP